MQDSNFQKTTLPNGLRVLTEHHPTVHSVTVGIWIQAGAVYERDDERGLAHLLEHLVFKGTQRRSSTKIAALMDAIGGQMNAFTEREHVCYHTKVLSEHLPLAMDLLCDLVTSPRLDDDDLELEKGVIIEEIRGVEDSPEELVEDLFTATIWPRSRWGRPILGTPDSVSKFSAEDVRRFLKTHYTPKNVVVVAVGDVNHDDIVKRAEKLLAGLSPDTPASTRRQPPLPTVKAHREIVQRDTEQLHLVCGTRSYAYDDPKRFASWTLDTILTGGYSSRLFQEIREKRGYAYNIGGLTACYRKGGFWAVEASLAPEAARKTVNLIGRELRKVKKDGVTRAEWKRALQLARANLLLSEESSSSQMGRIARNELYFGQQRSTEQVLADVMSVRLDDIHAVANEMFDANLMNLTAIGPLPDGEALMVDVG
jgi:predicted Zn-dependent peptidase